MRSSHRVIVLALIAAGGCTSSDAPPAPTRSVAQGIQDGVVDTKHRFAVGLCRGQRSTNPSEACPGRCSGMLILPNVVATARHCVDEAPSVIDCANDSPVFGARKAALQVTTNANLFGAGPEGWYTVDSYEVPDDDHVCGNDIALLVLSKPVPPEEATPVTPGVQYLMWDPAPRYYMQYSAIGFGQTGPGGTSGTRHRKDTIDVVCIPGAKPKHLDCPASAKVPPNEFVGGDGVCLGDSGSGAFERTSFEAGAPVAFGVLSRGSEKGDECAGSAYTRFDAHRDFVLRVARTASKDWTLYPEPPWTAPKPPPAPEPPVDAGPPPPRRAFGEPCATDDECASGICTDAHEDGAWLCSQSCEDADPASCPEGYACQDEICVLPAEPPPPPPVIMKRSGCEAGARAPASYLLAPPLGLAMAALAALCRRARRPTTDHP